MRELSEAEVGIPSKFCSGTGAEYRVASEMLEEISFHVVSRHILKINYLYFRVAKRAGLIGFERLMH
jgi:hypothetical protein